MEWARFLTRVYHYAVPAQLLTMSLAFAPSLSGALTIFIARSFIASMDSSVRGAFLSAVVPKTSRTRFLGVINVCKTLASAPGPTLSGQLASSGNLRFSFVITASIKIICLSFFFFSSVAFGADFSAVSVLFRRYLSLLWLPLRKTRSLISSNL